MRPCGDAVEVPDAASGGVSDDGAGKATHAQVVREGDPCVA